MSVPLSASRPDRLRRGARPWVALLVLGLGPGSAGCIDYGLISPDKPNPGVEDTAGGDGGEVPSGDTGAEKCGIPGIDFEVSVNESCVVDVEPGELDPVEQWEVPTFRDHPESDQVLMAPVVGHLYDDNGDGVIDRGDVPDVVVVTDDLDDGLKHGILRVLRGTDGEPMLDLSAYYTDEQQIFPYRYSNVALGDVNADGSPDIVVVVQVLGGNPGGGEDTAPPADGGHDDTGDNPISLPPGASAAAGDYSCFPAAFTPAGELLWLADTTPLDCAGHGPGIADLDEDGYPEVYVGNLVINGEDGSPAWKGTGDEGRYPAYTELGMHSVVADLDGDSEQELIAGRTIYESDGKIRCTAEGGEDGFGAVADLDGDGSGDFVVVGDGEVSTYDASCNPLSRFSLEGGGNGGPPTVGDLDGDGQPEIALCSATEYAAYEVDGTRIWGEPISDLSSHATGSLIFDFESDGIPEVVYADEVALHIFDGLTGAERLYDPRHSSRTLHDYPTVADIDGDGSVEIVVPNGGGHYEAEQTGIYVLESESGSWQAGREVWNQHAYSVTNIDDDLHVPAVPEPNWPTHNTFRSGDPNPEAGGLWPDAVPAAELCTAECSDGVLVLDMALANAGAAAMRAGVPLHAWYQDEAGDRQELGLEWSRAVTEAGAVSTTFRLRVNAIELDGRPIMVAADQDNHDIGYVDECDEGNNVTTLTDTRCP